MIFPAMDSGSFIWDLGKKKIADLLARGTPNPSPPQIRRITIFYFPTCQVRVVRFYQSCSSPSPSSPSPPPPLHPLPGPLPPLPCPLPPCQLFAKLFANFRAQWALLDLNCRLPIWVGTAGPQPQGSERSGHRWTSTWDLRSSVGTAGPQPGTLRAQWAPLDLNLGPSELSEHRWTSTAR